MSGEEIYPRVAVLCRNSEGEPEFHTCTPAVTHEQLTNGEHYERAKDNAADNGFEEPMIAFDATDQAAKELRTLAEWFGDAQK
jgi:hypothetical protein